MDRAIQKLIKNLKEFQKALDWEMDNRSRGFGTPLLDCEQDVQFARYEAVNNIKDRYFLRVWFEHSFEIRKSEIFDRYQFTAKILDKYPYRYTIYIDLDDYFKPKQNVYLESGFVSIQASNEEKPAILPLFIPIPTWEYKQELKEVIIPFKDYVRIQDEGFILLQELLDLVIALLEETPISCNVNVFKR
jgi:hypothetical protein